jgi:hypothetical protein
LFFIINNVVAGPNINEFFAAFSGDRRYFLHLPVLWTVTIDGVTTGAINSVLNGAGESWRASSSPNAYTRTGTILVAQQVVLPTESSNFSALESGSSMGGFLPGYGLNARSNFLDRGISVNFLETEEDIEHNFFRPWAIAVGIKGLVEDGPSLKGNMQVKQYTNSGKFIKGFQFKKIFPTAVEGFTLNYDSTDFKIKSVTFGCQNYEQL